MAAFPHETMASSNGEPRVVGQLREQLSRTLAELAMRTQELQTVSEKLNLLEADGQGAETGLREDVKNFVHDLRSPLSAISNWVQLRQTSVHDESVSLDELRQVSLSVDEITSILDGLAVRIGR